MTPNSVLGECVTLEQNALTIYSLSLCCKLQHYYFRSLKGKNGESVFAGCISQLVLQSREFDLLLGRLEPDGCRTPGIIDRFKVDKILVLHDWLQQE